MKAFSKNWRHSIYTRLIIVLLVLLLSFYFLGVLLFNLSKGIVTKVLFDSMRSQIVYFQTDFDHEIDHIKTLQLNFLNDEDINHLANASAILNNYEFVQTINEVQDRLTYIKNSSDYILNVSAYIPSINMIVNSLGTTKASYEDITDEKYDSLKKIPFDSDQKILYWDNRLLLISASPLRYVKDDSLPSFFIEAELSPSAIKNAMDESDMDESDRSILAGASRSFIITNEKDQGTVDRLLEMIPGDGPERAGTVSVSLDGKRYLTIYNSSAYSGTVIVRYIPEAVALKPLWYFQLFYWAFSIFALAIILLYSRFIYKNIQQPLLIMIRAFEKVQQGNFDIDIQYRHQDEFRTLFHSFLLMVQSLKTMIDQVYNQKILTQKAELKSLQAQINPHFLYNSYFLLHRMIKGEDYENAGKFSKMLGEYLRFITRNSSSEVSLIKEVEHARIYTNLQAIRYEGRIRVNFGTLPPELSEISVPKLILQPLIENAFEHGLANKQESGLLTVAFEKTDLGIRLSVEDNGDDLSDQELEIMRRKLSEHNDNEECTGIINIHRRIQLTYGTGSGISVQRSALGGLKASVEIAVGGGEKNV